MKKSVCFFCAVLFFVLPVSCGHRPPPIPQWTYAREAIHLRLNAAANLNLHEGKPHTLMFCVYQLRDLAAFNSLAEEIEGRYKLLECQPFDTSVVGAKRLFIHPGDNLNLLLDRQAGARYLAIVAGYYLLQKKRIIRVVAFPVITEEQGFMGSESTSRVARLDLEIRFGDQQIAGINIINAKGAQ